MVLVPSVTQGGSGVIARHRRAIPQAVKAAVIARDGMQCYRCQREVVLPERGLGYRPDELHFDHVIPWAVGGSDAADNLRVSCARCNLSRPKFKRIPTRRDVGYRCVGDDFFWTPLGYCPPKRLDHRSPYRLDLIDAADILGKPPTEMVVWAASGRVPATQGVVRPIGIDLHGLGIDAYVLDRMAELDFTAMGAYA